MPFKPFKPFKGLRYKNRKSNGKSNARRTPLQSNASTIERLYKRPGPLGQLRASFVNTPFIHSISRFAVDDHWAPNAAIGFYSGDAYLLRPIGPKAHVLNCVLEAHLEVIASLGRQYRIPDVERVTSPAANNYGGTPWPMLRYCTKPGESSDITVPGDFWYARDRWDERMTCNHKASRAVPWSNRTSKLVCNCGGYHRAGPFKGWNSTDGRSQKCCIEEGKPCVPCSGTRDFFRFNVAHKFPDMMQEGGLSPHLEDWSRYKYILHLDGISCSTRLLPYLGLGFTTFVEQSGFQQHFQPCLKKSAFALEHLKRESRERYWALVPTHFARLLTYPAVKREGAMATCLS